MMIQWPKDLRRERERERENGIRAKRGGAGGK